LWTNKKISKLIFGVLLNMCFVIGCYIENEKDSFDNIGIVGVYFF